MVEAYEQRIINGMLKMNLVAGLDEALRLLHRDIEVIGSPERVNEGDLWPAVWALCSALERQFTGRIHINVGLKGPLGQPARLGNRCVFDEGSSDNACLKIFLGCTPTDEDKRALIGDARGVGVRYGSLVAGSDNATPASCFALAGYLGFAALARSVGIPAFREDFTSPAISLPSATNMRTGGLDCLAFLGLGHLGQAYLSLLYFQRKKIEVSGKIALLDGGTFEDGNWHTQVLIEEDLGIHECVAGAQAVRLAVESRRERSSSMILRRWVTGTGKFLAPVTVSKTPSQLVSHNLSHCTTTTAADLTHAAASAARAASFSRPTGTQHCGRVRDHTSAGARVGLRKPHAHQRDPQVVVRLPVACLHQQSLLAVDLDRVKYL